jgi:DNA-binding LytR/AlgR family response regulator
VTRLLRVLAVDDERPALDELAYLLRTDPRVGEVRTACDGATAARAMSAGDLDAVFLDIRMPGINGLDVAASLPRSGGRPAVVFVTAYDEHAVTAFDLRAVDYLVKPVRADRLGEAVRRVLDVVAPASEWAPGDETIPVELAGTVRFVARADVTWVEAAGDYARLRTDSGSHLVRVPLTVLEDRWADAGFLRIHRSFLVNLRHIGELRFDGSHYTIVVDGHELPVSRRHSRALKDRLVRGARPGAT